MPNDHEAVVATLQLLLGDVSDDDKRALFYKAFPDSFILVKGDAKRMAEQFASAGALLRNALGIADGSSPLGILAVTNLRNELNAAKDNITAVRKTLGI